MKRFFKNKTMLPVLMLSLAFIVSPSDNGGSGGGGDIPYSSASASRGSVADTSTADAAPLSGAQASAQSLTDSHVAVVVADTVVRSKKEKTVKKTVKSKKTSVSSASIASTDASDLERNLFRAIHRSRRMEIEETLSQLGTLNVVSTHTGHGPLKAAVKLCSTGILRMLLKSGCPLHESDTTTLLGFVDNTIQELQKRERTKREQAKLNSYLAARDLLVNDTGGPNNTSRFISTTVVEGLHDDSQVLVEAERVILEESQAGVLMAVQLANKILRRVIKRKNVSADARNFLFEKYAQQCDPLIDSMKGVTLLESSVFRSNRYFNSTDLLVQKIVSMGDGYKKRALELLDSLKAKQLTSYKKDSSEQICSCLAKIYQAIHDLDSNRYPNTVFIMKGGERDSIMKDAVLRAIKNDLGTASNAAPLVAHIVSVVAVEVPSESFAVAGVNAVTASGSLPLSGVSSAAPRVVAPQFVHAQSAVSLTAGVQSQPQNLNQRLKRVLAKKYNKYVRPVVDEIIKLGELAVENAKSMLQKLQASPEKGKATRKTERKTENIEKAFKQLDNDMSARELSSDGEDSDDEGSDDEGSDDELDDSFVVSASAGSVGFAASTGADGGERALVDSYSTAEVKKANKKLRTLLVNGPAVRRRKDFIAYRNTFNPVLELNEADEVVDSVLKLSVLYGYNNHYNDTTAFCIARIKAMTIEHQLKATSILRDLMDELHLAELHLAELHSKNQNEKIKLSLNHISQAQSDLLNMFKVSSSFSHESSTLSAAASAGSGGGGGGGGGSGAAPVAKPRAAKRKLSGDRPVVDGAKSPASAEGASDESLNKKR
jgi:polyhydroxyalkanoate synthesis regulator phasin